MRIPTTSERLDPPLIDVHLKYGYKERNKTNPAEAEYIVAEVERRVLAEPPTLSSDRPGLDAGICAEAGDAVEVEFTEQDPPKRDTFILSLVAHDPNSGIVKVDSPIGQALLGAAVGDDLQLGHNGETVIVLGIFKGQGGYETPVSKERAYIRQLKIAPAYTDLELLFARRPPKPLEPCLE